MMITGLTKADCTVGAIVIFAGSADAGIQRNKYASLGWEAEDDYEIAPATAFNHDMNRHRSNPGMRHGQFSSVMAMALVHRAEGYGL